MQYAVQIWKFTCNRNQRPSTLKLHNGTPKPLLSFFFKPICHFLFHCYLSLWCQKVFLALIKHPFIPFKQIFPGSELSIVAWEQLGFVSYRRAKQFPWHKGQVQWVSSIKSWKQIQLHSKYTMMCVFCFLRSAPEFLSVFFSGISSL